VRTALAILIFVGACTLGSQAHAEPAGARPSVVVLGTPGEPIRAARVDLVAIELGRRAKVTAGWQLHAPSLPERIDEASREIVERKLEWVTWVELGARSPSGESTVVIVVVGRRGAQAAVEVRRLTTVDRDDLDRAIAIKAAEMLDAILSRPADAQAPEPSHTSSEHRGAEEVHAAAAEPTLAATLEAGARVATPSGTSQAQVLGTLGVGARAEWHGFAVEVVANGRSGSGFDSETARGTVTTREIALGGEARALWIREPLRLGGFAEAGARLIEGIGTLRDESEHSTWRSVPTLAAGADARLDATDYLAIRIAIGVEGMLRPQRFAIDDVPQLDVGDVRGFAHLSACFSLE